MDTIYVAVSDTIKTIAIIAWWKNPTWYSILIASIAIFFSILVFRHTRKLNERAIKREINSRWVNLTDNRLLFWTAIDESYNIWLQETGKNDVPSVNDLVAEAGLPPELGKRLSSEDLRKAIEKRLADKQSSQKWLLQFSDRVFCSWGHNMSILPNGPEPGYTYGYNDFYTACSSLTHELNGWAETESIDDLSYRFKGDAILITLLTWLEISLNKRLGKRWSDRRPLFNLAIKVIDLTN
ncbi:MAG: hypothetical protein V3W18_13930 [candidate division Zixibacteria bacterium]